MIMNHKNRTLDTLASVLVRLKKQHSGLAGRSITKTLIEFVDATAGIQGFLLARVEGVAFTADVDKEILAQRRTRFEGRTAAASCRHSFVVGMNISLHDSI